MMGCQRERGTSHHHALHCHTNHFEEKRANWPRKRTHTCTASTTINFGWNCQNAKLQFDGTLAPEVVSVH